MDKEVREVKNLTIKNKKHIKNKTIEIDLQGAKYPLVIRGAGSQAIKLELYIYYEDILKKHDSQVLEGALWDKINRVYRDTHSTSIGSRRVFY